MSKSMPHKNFARLDTCKIVSIQTHNKVETVYKRGFVEFNKFKTLPAVLKLTVKKNGLI